MQSWFTFELDGETCRIERVPVNRSLADHLVALDPVFASMGSQRESRLVVLGELEQDRHSFRVIDAASILLPMVAGRQIWTPLGIARAEPEHPVNLALQRDHLESGQNRLDAVRALLFEGYYRPDLRRQGQVMDQFDAIGTRTAHVPAIWETAAQVFASTAQLRHEAAQRAEKSGRESTVWMGRTDIFEDLFTKRLFKLARRNSMVYADAEKRRFYRPESVVELLKLRREYPEARLVAGGVEGKFHEGAMGSANFISLENLGELTQVITTEESWEIGAAMPLTRVSEVIGRECPAFPKMLRRCATRPWRNRATLGGHLAHCRSDSVLMPLLLALNARVMLLSEEGERDAPLSQLFNDQGETIRKQREVIRSIVIPRSGEGALSNLGLTARLLDAYTVAPNRGARSSFLTAAFSIELRDRSIVKARLAYAGLSEVPHRLAAVESELAGKVWSEEVFFECLPKVHQAAEVSVPSLTEAELTYRRQLAVTLFQKFHSQHPSADARSPRQLSSAVEFGKLQQPFFDALS
ncbi:MAG: FAD binding domain-containing protein [Verrucomicrobiota bacterium]